MIAINPVRAGLAQNPSEYPWSLAHSDCNLALAVKNCGLSLKEVAERYGSMHYSAVSEETERLTKDVTKNQGNLDFVLGKNNNIDSSVGKDTVDNMRNKPDVKIARLEGSLFGDTLWKARTAAFDWAQKELQGKDFRNNDTGWDIRISRSGLNKGIVGSDNIKQIEAVRVLPELLQNAVKTESRPDRAGDSALTIHRFYAPLELDGELYLTKITVKDSSFGQRYYNHELTGLEIEKPEGTLLERDLFDKKSSSIQAPQTSQSVSGPTQASTLSIADMFKGVKRDDGTLILNDTNKSKDLAECEENEEKGTKR
ncbi:MAG: hypothetical protein HQK96_15175 [Nitrospirae bacterium]|nr:hypothetical protein [Nitrospirota bacterium]